MNRFRHVPIPLAVVVVVVILAVVSVAAACKRDGAVKGVAKAAAVVPEKFFCDEDQALWARACIRAAYLRGLLKGDPGGRFRPDDQVKREELVVALVRFAGLEEAAVSAAGTALPFRDSADVLRRAAWACGYLAVARTAGILPEEEDQFSPGKAADRLWAAELLVRTLGLQDEAELRAGESPGFRDVGDVPPDKLGYLAVAVERGILQGFPDGTFRPKEKLRRAELAALLELAAMHRKQLGKYEVRGSVAEVVCEGRREIALHVDELRKELQRYKVSPDALVLVNSKEASLRDVKTGYRASLVLNPKGEAVVVSARSAEPEEKSVVLRGWLVDLEDLEGADVYGLVPETKWSRIRELLDGKFRLPEESGHSKGLERREERQLPAISGVVALMPADEGVARAMEDLLGKFVEIRAERVPEPNIYMRLVFRATEVWAVEFPPLKRAVPLPPGPGPQTGAEARAGGSV